jgi:hypothetical protein
MGEWCKFKVLNKKLFLLDMPDRVISMSDRFPLLRKLLSIVAVPPTSTASCGRGFKVANSDEKQIYVISADKHHKSFNDYRYEWPFFNISMQGCV